MRNYTARMDKYGLSRDRMMELKYVCRQYDAMCAELRRMRDGTQERFIGNSRRAVYSDPTANRAVKAADSRCRRRIAAIERAAKEADEGLAKYILQNACRGIPYAQLGVPCGENQFYKIRRRFYLLLDERL